MTFTPQQLATERLRAAEAEVQAAREHYDALHRDSTLDRRHNTPPAPLTHEIQLSEKQVDVLMQALDFYSRWCRGHFVLPNVVEFRRLPERDGYGRRVPDAGRPAVASHELLNATLDALRVILFPEMGHPRGSHGGVGWNEHSDQQHYQIAYEIRKALTGERNHRLGIENVDSRPWLHYSDQPLPVVRVFNPALGVAEYEAMLARYRSTFADF